MPPKRTDLPSLTRKVTCCARFLGTTCESSAVFSRVVSWFGRMTPGVSKRVLASHHRHAHKVEWCRVARSS